MKMMTITVHMSLGVDVVSEEVSQPNCKGDLELCYSDFKIARTQVVTDMNRKGAVDDTFEMITRMVEELKTTVVKKGREQFVKNAVGLKG